MQCERVRRRHVNRLEIENSQSAPNRIVPVEYSNMTIEYYIQVISILLPKIFESQIELKYVMKI